MQLSDDRSVRFSSLPRICLHQRVCLRLRDSGYTNVQQMRTDLTIVRTDHCCKGSVYQITQKQHEIKLYQFLLDYIHFKFVVIFTSLVLVFQPSLVIFTSRNMRIFVIVQAKDSYVTVVVVLGAHKGALLQITSFAVFISHKLQQLQLSLWMPLSIVQRLQLQKLKLSHGQNQTLVFLTLTVSDLERAHVSPALVCGIVRTEKWIMAENQVRAQPYHKDEKMGLRQVLCWRLGCLEGEDSRCVIGPQILEIYIYILSKSLLITFQQ